MSILEVKDLWKKYNEEWALQEINMSVESGEILGIIGENGAGKSTLIQCILGLIQPTKGTILIKNTTFQQDEIAAKKALAYIPELPLLYSDLTVWEHLKLVAMAYEMEREVFEKRGEALLRQFNLYEKRDRIPGNFSKGMKQKVAISCALLHDADLLLVDEPFTGLDVSSVRDLKEMLLHLHKQGKTLLIASHNLDAAEKMCRKFLMMKQGRCLALDDLSALCRKGQLPADSSLEDIYFALVEGGQSNE